MWDRDRDRGGLLFQSLPVLQFESLASSGQARWYLSVLPGSAFSLKISHILSLPFFGYDKNLFLADGAILCSTKYRRSIRTWLGIDGVYKYSGEGYGDYRKFYVGFLFWHCFQFSRNWKSRLMYVVVTYFERISEKTAFEERGSASMHEKWR